MFVWVYMSVSVPVFTYACIGKGRGNTKSTKFKAGDGLDDGIRFLREPIGERRSKRIRRSKRRRGIKSRTKGFAFNRQEPSIF